MSMILDHQPCLIVAYPVWNPQSTSCHRQFECMCFSYDHLLSVTTLLFKQDDRAPTAALATQNTTAAMQMQKPTPLKGPLPGLSFHTGKSTNAAASGHFDLEGGPSEILRIAFHMGKDWESNSMTQILLMICIKIYILLLICIKIYALICIVLMFSSQSESNSKSVTLLYGKDWGFWYE